MALQNVTIQTKQSLPGKTVWNAAMMLYLG